MWNKIQRIYVGSNWVRPTRPPSTYQLVERIWGVGDTNWNWPHINTWVTWTSNIWLKTEMLHTATRDNVQWFFSSTTGSTTRWGLTTYPSWKWCPQRENWIQTNVAYNVNQFYNIEFNYNNNRQCKIDGSNIQTLSNNTFNSWANITLGKLNYGTSYGYKIKATKITNWTTLIRYYVPCYRKSDSVIGMYDLVNNQFYTNAWSWTFTKWGDVN